MPKKRDALDDAILSELRYSDANWSDYVSPLCCQKHACSDYVVAEHDLSVLQCST